MKNEITIKRIAEECNNWGETVEADILVNGKKGFGSIQEVDGGLLVKGLGFNQVFETWQHCIAAISERAFAFDCKVNESGF